MLSPIKPRIEFAKHKFKVLNYVNKRTSAIDVPYSYG